MPIKVQFINSNQARYTDEEFSFILTYLLSEGVFNKEEGNDDLSVGPNSPVAMNVLVESGAGLITYTKDGITWKVIITNSAQATITVTPNSSGANRVDAMVVELSQAEPNALKNNVASLTLVVGSGINALTDGAIDTILGHANWIRLADITVPDSAVSISAGNIADTRNTITIGKDSGGYQTIIVGDGSGLTGVMHNPMDTNLLPDVDITRDIGSPSKRIKDIYSEQFHGDGSDLTNVPGTGEIISGVLGEIFPSVKERVLCSLESFGSADFDLISTSYQTAQAFTLPSNAETISKIQLMLTKLSSPLGTLTVDIFAVDGNGKPTGSSLATSASQDAADLVGDTDGSNREGVATFEFASPLAVTGGVTYTAVLSRAVSSSGTVLANVLTGLSVPTDWSERGFQSTNSGSSWGVFAVGAPDQVMPIRVFGTITEEEVWPVYVQQDTYTELQLGENTGKGSATTDHNIYAGLVEAGVVFTTRDCNFLTRVQFKLGKTGAPVFTVTASLFLVDGNDEPTGAALATDTVDSASIVNDDWREFVFNIAVTAETRYVVILDMTGGGDISNKIEIQSKIGGSYSAEDFEPIKTTDGGTSYTHSPQGALFSFWGYETLTTGRLYQMDPNHVDKVKLFGIPNNVTASGMSAGSTQNFKISGYLDGLYSAMPIGQDMYLPALANLESFGVIPYTTDGDKYVGSDLEGVMGLDTYPFGRVSTKRAKADGVFQPTYDPNMHQLAGVIIGQALKANVLKVQRGKNKEFIWYHRISTLAIAASEVFGIPRDAKGVFVNLRIEQATSMEVTVDVNEFSPVSTDIVSSGGAVKISFTWDNVARTLTVANDAGSSTASGGIKLYFYK